LEGGVLVIGSSIPPLAFLRFQKFRNYKESMSAKVRSQKRLSDQNIAKKTNLKRQRHANRRIRPLRSAKAGIVNTRRAHATIEEPNQCPWSGKRTQLLRFAFFPIPPASHLAGRGNHSWSQP
jgi:hypothetical protein